MISLLGRGLRTHEHRHVLQQAVHPARPPEGDLLTFNQLAEYVIWALLQPSAVDVDVDVDTIIVHCFGAMI
jgi:hypothetical protein